MDGKIKAQRYRTEHFTSHHHSSYTCRLPATRWCTHAPCCSRFDWALASTLACPPTATTAQGGTLPPCPPSDSHCKPTPPPAVNVSVQQILLPNDRLYLFAWFLSSGLLEQWSPKKYSALSDFLLSVIRALRHLMRLACHSWLLTKSVPLWRFVKQKDLSKQHFMTSTLTPHEWL